MKTTFIDFWLRGVLPGDLLDHRAVAETELAAFLDRIDLGEHRPLVFLCADHDWLADGIPPDWIADMLQTIGRYPAADYHLHTIAPEFWQMRLAAVARLDSPGGHLARAWLDGVHPPGLRVDAPPASARVLAAIPMAQPRKRGLAALESMPVRPAALAAPGHVVLNL